MDNQRIKIGYVDGTESNDLSNKRYEAFKPYGNGSSEFHRHGRIYDIRGLFGFRRGNKNLEIIMANGIAKDLEAYETIKDDRKADYLRKRNSKRKL